MVCKAPHANSSLLFCGAVIPIGERCGRKPVVLLSPQLEHELRGATSICFVDQVVVSVTIGNYFGSIGSHTKAETNEARTRNGDCRGACHRSCSLMIRTNPIPPFEDTCKVLEDLHVLCRQTSTNFDEFSEGSSRSIRHVQDSIDQSWSYSTNLRLLCFGARAEAAPFTSSRLT